MIEPIILPWRSFKAFTQFYEFAVEGHRLSHRESLLIESNTPTGAETRAPLVRHALIDVTNASNGALEIRYCQGVPLGRNNNDQACYVVPDMASKPGAAWLRSVGRCSYCGEILRFFYQHALSDNGTLACKTCHATKGTRSLEEFRFLMAMKQFEEKNGVRFTRQQVDFLGTNGFCLVLPTVMFWFEQIRQHITAE